MTTAILSDGMQYTIPNSDIEFFKAIASRMGWIATRVGNAITSSVEVEKPQESVGDAYSLSKLKGRFTPMYFGKDTLRDDYLSDKYGV